ncbi:hypothetical protein HMPREF1545_02289 [Oscillibacter sp. KLE 1728]|nr:hypothetical protein HMPREF1545_02289 [Oscillibacter sp. KLE 1728]ERK61268.1 hypothetical protein HMPREF1546_03163 [Oscillibacter sp. KLE 1745]
MLRHDWRKGGGQISTLYRKDADDFARVLFHCVQTIVLKWTEAPSSICILRYQNEMVLTKKSGQEPLP